LIQEYGAPACYWAYRHIQTIRGKVTQYAMAQRNGLKRVVLMSTTLPKCGPGMYTFITKKPYIPEDKCDNDSIGKWNDDDDSRDEGYNDYSSG
jgi:hypothetical protein